MIDFGGLLRLVEEDLRGSGVSFAIIGGIAMGGHGEPRFTKDLDVAVSVKDDDEAESLVRGMMARGYQVQAVVEQTATGRLATVRLAPPGHPIGPIVDLLFASSGIEPEVVSSADPLEVLPGLHSPVARASHLLALKVLSRDDERRPQDRLDIQTLLAMATAHDVDEARAALKLITRRGCNRGRELEAALDAALREFPRRGG